MQLLKENTPYDYMYANNMVPMYGGVGGGVPTPPQYPYMQQYGTMNTGFGYNQNPYPMNSQYMIGTMPNQYDPYSMGLTNGVGKTYEEQQNSNSTDLSNSMVGMSADDMMHRFAYQNDPRYQNYNSNPFSQPVQGYNGYYGIYGQQPYQVTQNYGKYYNPNNPYATHEEGYYNPYLSDTMMENVMNDYSKNGGKVTPFTTANTGINSFAMIANQQKEMQERWENNQNTIKMLCGICGIEQTPYQPVDPEVQKKQYEDYVARQETIQVSNYVNWICANVPDQSTYENPQRRAYIEAWNNKHDEWAAKFPAEYSMYDFFNGGIAENMYMETLIVEAKKRERDLNGLYNRAAFQNKLNQLHPDYDPQESIPLYQRQTKIPLTLDDMEIRLPDSIRNSDHFKRQQQFIDAIINKMPS